MLLKISLLASVLMVGIGINMAFIRRQIFSFILGISLTIKACIFAAACFVANTDSSRSDVIVVIFVGLVLMLLLVLTAVALIMRNKRFGVSIGFAEKSDIKY